MVARSPRLAWRLATESWPWPARAQHGRKRRTGELVGQLFTWIEENPSADLSLPAIARQAAMSCQDAGPAFSRASRHHSGRLDRARACPPCASLVGNDTVGGRASGRRIWVWISGRNAPALRRNCRNDSTAYRRAFSRGDGQQPGVPIRQPFSRAARRFTTSPRKRAVLV